MKKIPITVIACAILVAIDCIPAANAMAAVKLPYEKGKTFVVTQGYDSLPTHTKQDRYALDFTRNGCDAYGMNVVAAASGTVIFVGQHGYNGGYGTELILGHGNNIVSRYAHMIPGSIMVADGDAIRQGQPLGLIGDTGLVIGTACAEHPGTHLHFSMDTMDGIGGFSAYDPEPISGYSNMMVGKWYLSDNGEDDSAEIATSSAPVASLLIVESSTDNTTDVAIDPDDDVSSTDEVALPFPPTIPDPAPDESAVAEDELPIAGGVTSVPAVTPPEVDSDTGAIDVPVDTTSTPDDVSSSTPTSTPALPLISTPGNLTADFDGIWMLLNLSWATSTDLAQPTDRIDYEMNYTTSTSFSDDAWVAPGQISVVVGNSYLIGLRAKDTDGNISDIATTTWNFPPGFAPYKLSAQLGSASQYFVVPATSTLVSIRIFTSNFQTSARYITNIFCYLQLSDERGLPPENVTQADGGVSGIDCGNSPTFFFSSSPIVLYPDHRYQWTLTATTGNPSTGAAVYFYGTMVNTAEGPFSDPSLVNAKFTVTGDSGVLFSN